MRSTSRSKRRTSKQQAAALSSREVEVCKREAAVIERVKVIGDVEKRRQAQTTVGLLQRAKEAVLRSREADVKKREAAVEESETGVKMREATVKEREEEVHHSKEAQTKKETSLQTMAAKIMPKEQELQRQENQPFMTRIEDANKEIAEKEEDEAITTKQGSIDKIGKSKQQTKTVECRLPQYFDDYDNDDYDSDGCDSDGSVRCEWGVYFHRYLLGIAVEGDYYDHDYGREEDDYQGRHGFVDRTVESRS